MATNACVMPHDGHGNVVTFRNRQNNGSVSAEPNREAVPSTAARAAATSQPRPRTRRVAGAKRGGGRLKTGASCPARRAGRPCR